MCCPCFGKAPVNCDEFVCSRFGKEFTEFEYVIENLAIRRVPKKLLDIASCCPQPKLKSCPVTCNKKCGRGRSAKKPAVITCGPVVEVEDIPPDEATYCLREQYRERGTSYKKPCACHAYYTDISPKLDETMVNQFLKPQPIYEDTWSNKLKVSADIHKVTTEGDKPVKIIPTEIKETIDALKVAKPLHLTSEVHTRNHRSLLQSFSTMSCDKETSCNFAGDPKAEGDSGENVSKEKEEKHRRFTKIMKRNSPPKKVNKTSPSTSESAHFPDIIECNEIENADLQPTKESPATPQPESPKAQTLKWRIIINKHKKR